MKRILLFNIFCVLLFSCEQKDSNNSIQSIKIVDESLTVFEFEEIDLPVCEVIYSDGKTTQVEPQWTIIDNSLAAINSEEDKITGLKAGTTQLKATYQDNVATAVLTISENNVISLEIINPIDTLIISHTHTFKIRTVFESGSEVINPQGVALSSNNNKCAITDFEVLGTQKGSETIQARLNGKVINASIYISDIESTSINTYLEKPMAGAIVEIPVVIIRYLPTADGKNLDVSIVPDYWSLNEMTLSQMKTRIDLFDVRIKFMLEEGSKFRGYKNESAVPYIGYKVIKYLTVYSILPKGKKIGENNGYSIYHPDMNAIFERLNIENYVDNHGAKEIWFWQSGMDAGYPSYDPLIHNPYDFRSMWESNMSSPTTADISNSDQDVNDLPIYNSTYTVYGQNFRRSQAEAVHNHGHQLERLFTYAELNHNGMFPPSELFWQKFVGQKENGGFITGRCGWTHMPPNTTEHYDYLNTTEIESDIEDWKPDGSGQKKSINVNTWGNLVYDWPNPTENIPQQTESQWYIYWMQSIPGYNNNIPYNSSTLSNWWEFVADWDNAISSGYKLWN